MEPIGPLMWEHRAIERAVGLVEKGLDRIRSTGQLEVRFLALVTDFFHMYADRAHHGKEEDILFRELGGKPLSAEHKKTIDELLSDHVKGRELVKQINDGLQVYREETARGLEIVAGAMEGLLRLYPPHIEREDKHFFYPVLDYFTREERGKMLQASYEFDRQLIHERYRDMLEEMEGML